MRESIYKHNFFAKKHLNYYVARNILFKEGYKMVDYELDWKITKIGIVKFSDGICNIILKTDMIPSKTDPTKLVCNKIMSVSEWTDD